GGIARETLVVDRVVELKINAAHEGGLRERFRCLEPGVGAVDTAGEERTWSTTRWSSRQRRVDAHRLQLDPHDRTPLPKDRLQHHQVGMELWADRQVRMPDE